MMHNKISTFEKLKRFFLEFPSVIFDPTLENKYLIPVWFWLIGLYLVGFMFWGTLFDWRHSPLSYYDWYHIFLPRHEVMRDAINYRMMPLHTDCECLHGSTDRFLTSPDTITTPQMVLLAFMDADTFAIFDLFVHYTIATLGLMILRRKLQLSLVAFSFLFFMFNLNGHIQTHYIVGHLNWGGYFIFPYFVLLMLSIVDKKPSWKWVASMALLSLYLVLAGSQHHFTWWMLFLVFLALIQRTLFKSILTTILFSGFLGAIRLLPPLIQINDFRLSFRTGYFTFYELLTSFVIIRPVDFILPELNIFTRVGYWEMDYYIGLIGFSFIAYFGLVYWLKAHERLKKYIPLFVPTLLIFILSYGQIYGYTFFNLPLLASERVTSRMISVPVTILMVLSAIGFQGFLELNKSSIMRWLTIGGLVILVSDIYTHIIVWKVDKVGKLFGIEKLQFHGNSIVNHSDPQYITIVWMGIGITFASALILLLLVRKEKSKKDTA